MLETETTMCEPAKGETTPPVEVTPLWRAAEAAADARRFIEDRFGDDLSDQAADSARLVVSELATNAFIHGEGAITLKAQLLDDRLRVEVVDEGSGNTPAIRAQSKRDGGGWGLRIVDALSLEWGAYEGTSHVWADIPTA